MKTTATTVKSQLHNAGANAPVAPISAIAMFVQGDIKGGEAAHNYRMQVIAASIREALKGNSRALIEAATFAIGKTKKARAYAAGFAAIGLPDDVPARVQYSGKLDAPENEAARALIAERSASYEFDFESAFLTAMDAPKEPKVKKTDPVAVVADDADDVAPVADTVAESAPVAVADMLVSDVITAAIAAIGAGLLVDDEAANLQKALDLYYASKATEKALAQAAQVVTA